ncbi:hypothetical protein V8C35DRAFT_333965 [Trichoderma chlorosporum]
MPTLSKPSRSPRQATKLPGPSDKDDGAKAKADFVGRPDKGRSILVAAEWRRGEKRIGEWAIGNPYPTVLMPPGFVPNLQFRSQIHTAVPSGMMKQAFENWVSSACKTRPTFSHVLFAESLQGNPLLLAGYLGFNTSREFHVWVDFEVPKIIKHLILFYYAQNQPSTADVRSFLPQATDVEPHHFLVYKAKPGKLVTKEATICVGSIDPVLSLLSASYKLIKSNPGRFCHKTPSQSDQYVWNIHHEDWMRAHAVVMYTVEGQIERAGASKSLTPGNKPCIDLSIAWKYYLTVRSELYGYATLETACKSAKENMHRENSKTSILDYSHELTLLDSGHDVAEMPSMPQTVTADITNTLRTNETCQPQGTSKPLRATKYTECEQSLSIVGQACTALDIITPGVNLDKELYSKCIPTDKMQPPITRHEVGALKRMLMDQVLRPKLTERSTKVDQNSLQEANPKPATATGFEDLAKLRAQLGDNPPPNEDLEKICAKRNINVDTLVVDVNSSNQSIVAKAPQISDANRLAELLGGPLRSAMLLSEGGTGKTFVTLLTLKFLIEDRLLQFNNGMLYIEGGDRLFKPNIMFVPGTEMYQVLEQVCPDWTSLFNIWLLHKANSIKLRSDKIASFILNPKELQKRLDYWATESEHPSTGKVLLLTTYQAWVEFTSVLEAGQQLTGNGTADETKPAENNPPPNNTGNHSDGRPEESGRKQVCQDSQALKNAMWNVAILYECRLIQSTATDYSKMALQLNRNALLLVSAHPLAAIKDLYTYLKLMWQPDWPFTYSFEQDPAVRERLHNSGTYDSLLQKAKANPRSILQVVAGGISEAHNVNQRQPRRCQEYLDFVLDGHGPAYLLHPELFKGPRFAPGYLTDSLAAVARKILEMVSVRRDILTPMKLPNGEVTCLGKDMGGLTVRTVELLPTASSKQKLREHKFVFTDLLNHANESTTTVEEDSQSLENPWTVHFLMSMVSTDVKNISLITPTDKLLKRLVRLQQSAKRPIFEDTEMQALDTTGGLQWLFYNSRDSDKYGFPTDKLNQIRYVAWDSPKYCHVLSEAFKAQEVRERLLVLANNPWTGRIMNALLVACGIKSLFCKPTHSRTEMKRAINDSNNGPLPYTCIVTTLQCPIESLKLHESCHRGIIMELPMDYATLSRAISQLWRLGQKRDVIWEILIAQHSFDSFMEVKMLAQYADVLAVTGRIDAAITGEARRICAFEIMRQQFGQECSRYPRVGVPWHKLDEDELRQEGYFYSALAEFFFKNPAQASLLDSCKIRKLLQIWDGMEITTAMVERLAASEDGKSLMVHRKRSFKDHVDGTTCCTLPPTV